MSEPALPWFAFDVDDWLTSPTVLGMSFAAQGVYVRLLCHQWRDGKIPADPDVLARFLRADRKHIVDALVAFREVKGRGIRRNLRMEKQRRAKYAQARQAQADGAKGGSRDTRGSLDRPSSDPLQNEKEKEKESKREGTGTARPRSQASNGKPSPTEQAALRTWFAAAFWPRYPLKRARNPALAALLKLNPDEALQARILAHVAVIAGDIAWVDKEGRKCGLRASTYLNQERWNDGDDAPDGGKPAPAFRCRFCGAGLETDAARTHHERDVCSKGRTP